MAKYALNQAAVDNCRRLIEAKQYVLNSDWGEVQPRADAQNALPGAAFLGGVRRLASWPHRGCLRRDEGPLRIRVRRLPARAPYGPDRLRLPRFGMAAQGGRARGPRPFAAPGCHFLAALLFAIRGLRVSQDRGRKPRDPHGASGCGQALERVRNRTPDRARGLRSSEAAMTAAPHASPRLAPDPSTPLRGRGPRPDGAQPWPPRASETPLGPGASPARATVMWADTTSPCPGPARRRLRPGARLRVPDGRRRSAAPRSPCRSLRPYAAAGRRRGTRRP